ncbi:MAG: squalene/phytoene synthase family protein [Burkholderiales bacterium]|nr:squalene/phytoene synthase family protein [Burkholderiales bacterium]
MTTKPAATPEIPSSDAQYQNEILQGVSRTFALTIPQLPDALRPAVVNAYLLCRIADTIEDEVALTAAQKRQFAQQFIDIVAGRAAAEPFAAALSALLSEQTLAAERELVANSARVLRITHALTPAQQSALLRCVTVMANGMALFQANKTPQGLADLAQLDSYCYFVAGVVGEMLTELYCDYSDEIRARREVMLRLAVSFGQGLQMTNILKDIWEDRSRGACWLPQDIFRRHGFELSDLNPGQHDAKFGDGLGELIAIAHAHLENALTYTLMIPRREKGIRRFCFWALGMAVLTLRKINRHRDFTSGRQVKISRRSVKATIAATHLTNNSDAVARLMFNLAASGLPKAAASRPNVFSPATTIIKKSDVGPVH